MIFSQARPFLNDGRIEMLVDPRLGEEYDLEELKRLTFSASLCIRATARLRPSMTEVSTKAFLILPRIKIAPVCNYNMHG